MATPAPPVPPAPKNPGIDPIHPTRNMSTPPDGPILEPKPAPYPGGINWEALLTWPSTTPRDPRPGAPDPGPIPKPNPYPTGPRGVLVHS